MKVLIIPCAQRLPPDMEIKFGEIPSIMVPLNKEPLMKKIYVLANMTFDLILILTHNNSKFIQEYISQMNLVNVQILDIDKLKDIGYTISCGLNFLDTTYGLNNIRSITVNFGDTLVEDFNFSLDANIIAYADVIDSKRWTTFEYTAGRILNIVDKSEREIGTEFYHTFIGVFKFIDVAKFNFFLKVSLCNQKIEHYKDSFYEAIEAYNKLNDFCFFHSKMWVDLGHSDKYKFITNNETRFFNSIDIDQRRGIITKKSTDWQKLTKEIDWYLSIPKQLKYLTPHVIDFEVNSLNTYVSLEFYNYPTLQEIYVFGNYSVDRWKLIFDAIFFIQKEFSRFKKVFPKSKINKAIEEMYVDKTLSRIGECLCDKHLKMFFCSDTVSINGQEFPSLKYFLNNLNNLATSLGLYDTNAFSPIHGDFCFSNLLYDPLTNVVRLVDPRGTFGDFKIYGDVRYEYAKISHCINGGYDLIVRDFFKIEVNDRDIKFKVKEDEKYSAIKCLFKHKLDSLGVSNQQIVFIEAILFISMIPLHRESPKRQIAMLCTSLRLIESILTFDTKTKSYSVNINYD
ncbi:hypothetical protein [Sphingobacterium faecium]|uniref:hypothetical protein n=1 Tax=Sphingobacterium faecium TaxID=34087 RepID=UPI003208FEE7